MASNTSSTQFKVRDEISNFANGCVAGILGTTTILPVDYLKVKVQAMAEGHRGKYEGTLNFAKKIYKEKGVTKFFAGATPALARQSIYSTTRFGLYKTLSDYEKVTTNKENINFSNKALYATLSGGIGSLLGNPFDVLVARMRNDKFKFNSLYDAMVKTTQSEGVSTFWKGSIPTVLRCSLINLTTLAVYDQSKETLDRRNGALISNMVVSSLFAALMACISTMPFDNIKIKYQKREILPDGKTRYQSVGDCVMKSLKSEGFLRLYAGWHLYFAKLGISSVISLLMVEFLNMI